MLFLSTADDVIRRVFQEAALAGNSQRKTEAAKRLDFYHDGQLDYLRARLREVFEEPDRLTPAFINIVKKITNLLSMVYMQDAQRDVEGSDGDKSLYADIAGQAGLPVKMKLASRYTKLLKTILLRPVWRNGRLDIDVLTPNILDVETGDSPEDLKTILITHYGATNRAEEVTYSLWTPEVWRKLDYRGREISSEPNPYGVLPFVPCWDRMPTDSFWLGGGDDLITAQEAINLKLTDLLYTLQFQGFGVGWISGVNQGDITEYSEVKAGPGSLVQLPQDGKLGYEATKAPISEILEAIDWLAKQAAVSNGIPAASLSTKPTEESGVSKIVSNRELDELRRDDIALWAGYERRLFNLMRTVWNVHNPNKKLADGASLLVDFYDPRPVTSPKDQAETWDRLLAMGAISLVDVAMARNPDLKTREDALAHLLTLKDEQAALEEKQI